MITSLAGMAQNHWVAIESRIVEGSARSGCSLIVHSVCIDFSYRWLACVPLYLALHDLWPVQFTHHRPQVHHPGVQVGSVSHVEDHEVCGLTEYVVQVATVLRGRHEGRTVRTAAVDDQRAPVRYESEERQGVAVVMVLLKRVDNKEDDKEEIGCTQIYLNILDIQLALIFFITNHSYWIISRLHPSISIVHICTLRVSERV